jgi:WD40 repeat protein
MQLVELKCCGVLAKVVSRRFVVSAIAAGTAAACAFLIVILVHHGLADAAEWAGVVGALAAVLAVPASLLVLLSEPPPLPVPVPDVPEWLVDRPQELAALLDALTDSGAGTVGITTGLHGAGGFGKTILARMACADDQVQQRFGGHIYWTTVGRDVRGPAAIAAKVSEVIRAVSGKDASFTDPALAGAQLGAVLDTGPPRLLVLDDVWDAGQLEAFTVGGKKCTRLVTTRVPDLLIGRGTAVLVDQMTSDQARAVLMAGLPPIDESLVGGLLAVTGRWPLLLRLVNKILIDYGQMAGAAAVAAQVPVLLGQFAAAGPAVVDDLRGNIWPTLDVGQPEERAKAVRATIKASTDLLGGADADRFTELGMFAEDESIPFSVVAELWKAKGGISELRAAQVCRRLIQLALVTEAQGAGSGITLHDVIRDFLRAELGKQQLAGLNGVFLDAIAARLPVAGSTDRAEGHVAPSAWWELGSSDPYLWDHLIEHLRDAGRIGEAESVACDLRWVGARLERFGPAAPAIDLSTADTPHAARLRGVVERAAHLLAPTDPPGSVIDILHCRVAADKDWGPQVTALDGTSSQPRLVSQWPLPDLSDPQLRRVLDDHASSVTAAAVAPDGSWLATGHSGGTARIWEPDTGRVRAVLKGHTREVTAVAVAPDGSWLATGSGDHTVRIWDAATGRERVVLEAHSRRIPAVAVAPDGSWLATSSGDRAVRIWDLTTGRERTVLQGHDREVTAVAVAPDGSWLATGSDDHTVRIWDAATGRERAVLEGHTGPVEAISVAPDGSWLATCAHYDGTVRIWQADVGEERAVLNGNSDFTTAVLAAPDGSWLATTSHDGAVRIWDTGTVTGTAGGKQAARRGYTDVDVELVPAPDGSWLAVVGFDWTVRICEAATGDERVALKGHTRRVTAVAVASDSSWLATTSYDGTARIWDSVTGRERAVLKGHTDRAMSVAVEPGGSWLATGSDDRTVRIWDVATGRERAVLKGHTDQVRAVAVAPDGSWLASTSCDGTGRRTCPPAASAPSLMATAAG